MASISNSVPLSQVSSAKGWEIEPSSEGQGLAFMPISIDIIAEVGTAYQSTVPDIIEFTNAKKVAELCGDASPAYAAARMLRPSTGDRVGSIPARILVVKEASGATATVTTTTIVGTATANKTHYLKINNRKSLDNQMYAFSISIGDAPAVINLKMADAVNKVFGCPVIGTTGVGTFIATTGWKGETSAELEIEIDTDGDSAGISYSVVKVAGAGLLTTGLATALTNRGTRWSSMIINCLPNSSTILNAFEADNGTVAGQTGNYVGTDFNPYLAFTGNRKIKYLTESSGGAGDGATEITNARKNQMTNVIVPGIGTKYWSYELAAAAVAAYAPRANSIPHLDPIGMFLPEIEAPEDMGDFATSTTRDFIIKVGCSTLKQNGTQLEIMELSTTAHPDNEIQTAVSFRFVRNMIIQFNFYFSYRVYYNTYVFGKTIMADNAITSATNIIKPKTWKAILIKEYAKLLIDNAMMVDIETFKAGLQVQIGKTNSNRLETRMGTVKIPGSAIVGATTIVTSFNYN
jgi:phage tail sheath gpL-like